MRLDLEMDGCMVQHSLELLLVSFGDSESIRPLLAAALLANLLKNWSCPSPLTKVQVAVRRKKAF